MKKNIFLVISAFCFLGFSLSSCNNVTEKQPLNSVNTLSTTGWHILPGMSEPRYNLQATVIKGEIYLTGGLNDRILDTFEKFDPESGEWEKLPNLPQPRYIHSAVNLNDKLYLIGGYNFRENNLNLVKGQSKRGAMSAVEMYDPETEKWTSKASLLQPRFMPGAVVFANKIYVAGGASNGKILDSVEMYDPEKNTWQLIAKTPNPVVWGKLVTDNKYLYLIGGSTTENQYLESIDRFDPMTKTWTENYLPPPPVKRTASGVTINEKGIYVAGGSNEQGFVNNCDFYDFQQKKWFSLPSLNPPRGGIDLVSIAQGLFLFGTDAWYTNNTLFLPY